jgi:glycosyltransferase involved in cell wall biosynthesis
MESRAMKIVKVSHHSCIRVHKEAMALLNKGYRVHLLANKWVEFSDIYHTFGHWLDMAQLHNFIKLHASDTDLFHVHNEPSWFVTLIKETCDVPVILDIHDSFAARVTDEEQQEAYERDGTELIRITAEERNNFKLADALVFPGRSFADTVINEFNLKQPHIILPSYLPRHLYRYNMQDWYGGLVYEGKVQLKAEGRSSYGFRYCDYLELAKECKRIGIDLHFYSREDKPFIESYREFSYIHKPVHYSKLTRCISRHDWGLVGNINQTPEWDVAMPNKLFEYMASGVPIAVINAKDCADFVLEHGVGIVVESLEELASRWSEHVVCRENVIKKRAKWSMDENIFPLEELYRKVLDGRTNTTNINQSNVENVKAEDNLRDFKRIA